MRIEDLPRPWLLAAMTGVPMAILLEQAERERAGQAEEASPSVLGEEYPRSRRSAADRPALRPLVGPIELRKLAS